jgi:hypothetical protein
MTDDRPISALFAAFTDWMLAAGHKDVSTQPQPWHCTLKTEGDALDLTFNCSGNEVKDAKGLAIPAYTVRIVSTVYLAVAVINPFGGMSGGFSEDNLIEDFNAAARKAAA